jgi:hypothetical protein
MLNARNLWADLPTATRLLPNGVFILNLGMFRLAVLACLVALVTSYSKTHHSDTDLEFSAVSFCLILVQVTVFRSRAMNTIITAGIE